MSDRSSTGERDIVVPGVVPVFPLPDHVLLPVAAASYQIFEPRYRDMMRYLLDLPDHQRWLAIPRIEPGSEPAHLGTPPFATIATVGRILESVAVADGTYRVVVGDGVRCLLEEIPSERTFRFARAEPWPDLPPLAGAAEIAASFDAVMQLTAALVRALGPGARGLATLGRQGSDRDARVYLLGNALIQRADRRQEFLEARHVERRLEMLLDTAALFLSVTGTSDRDPGRPS